MKSNFKYIVIFIIGSLFIVFLVQLFWLKGLYNSIEAETEKNVFDCVNIANSYELEYRLDSIEASPKEDRYKGEISISQSVGDNDTKERGTPDAKRMIKNKRVVQSGDTIQDIKEEIGDEEFSLAQFEKLGTMIRETIHQTLDSITSIRLDTLHSALLVALEAKKIKSDIYKIEVVDFTKDSVMQQLNITQTSGTLFVVDYTYDSGNQLGYRVYLGSFTKTILSQMFGILSTTALIILILGIAFWYLIKTVLRQKTLEEMKDDFTNNITHELKTPIAVAYSATDALLNFRQAENKETRDKYLTICKDQLEHLTGLVEQILSMSMERRQTFTLNKEGVHIKNLIKSIVEQHRLKADKEIIFR